MEMRIALQRLKSAKKFARKKQMIFKLLQKTIPLGRVRFQNFHIDLSSEKFSKRQKAPHWFFFSSVSTYITPSLINFRQTRPLLLVILN